jgi:hypothetical protein
LNRFLDTADAGRRTGVGGAPFASRSFDPSGAAGVSVRPSAASLLRLTEATEPHDFRGLPGFALFALSMRRHRITLTIMARGGVGPRRFGGFPWTGG